MPSLADYFNEKGYKPKYWIGDRVFGHWNKIPFVGTVGNDTEINEADGPQVSVPSTCLSSLETRYITS